MRGCSPLESGAALIPVAIGMAVIGPVSSRLSARLGPKAEVATGVVLVWMPGRDHRPAAGEARAPAGQAAEPARG